MTTPQFIQWLEGKMKQYGNGKVIPGDRKLNESLQENVESILQEKIRDRILEEAGYSDQVQQETDRYKSIIGQVSAGSVRASVERELNEKPVLNWRNPLNDIAMDLVEKRK